jgi:hypothetical protein
VSDLVLALKTGGDAGLMTAVVEAMTTNESSFFRDKTPFEHFRRAIIPSLLAARRQSQPGLYAVRGVAPRLPAQHGTTHARPRLIAINGGR